MAATGQADAGGDRDTTVEEVFYGEPMGVEVERESDPSAESKGKPWDPETVRVSTRIFALRNILDMIRDGDIELTENFQRKLVWKKRQKSRLIESLLLQIPLPAFYFAQDKDGKFWIVDGLQRLTTMHEYASGTFALEDLEYLDGELGKTFDDLTPQLRRRLQNAQIVVQVIEPSTPDAVRNDIFMRLNTGGEPLTAMEIRHRMSNDRSRNLLERCAANAAFHAATGGALLNHVRMHDREAVLRFLAFYRLDDISDYDEFGSLDALLDATVAAIDDPAQVSDTDLDHWSTAFEQAMVNARIVFGDDAFRKLPRHSGRRSPINRALLESWGVTLADYRAEQLEPVAARIADAARAAMTTDARYLESITSFTSAPDRVRTRFDIPRKIMAEAVSS